MDRELRRLRTRIAASPKDAKGHRRFGAELREELLSFCASPDLRRHHAEPSGCRARPHSLPRSSTTRTCRSTNNRTERALRGLVIGRKNHYGSRSERGTQVAATFYTVLETALLAGIDPREFLRHAVERQIIEHEPTLPWSQAL
jgi:Transposase IS66 family